MKIVSFMNQKGGVGKSLFSVNMSSLLAEKGYKVLLIDNDPQSNSTLSLFQEETENTLYDIYLTKESMDKVIKKTNIENLYIAPNSLASIELNALISQKVAREFTLDKAIRKMKTDFDYVIIDCNPNLDILSANALTASDYVVIPVDESLYSFAGLNNLLKYIGNVQEINQRLEVSGIIVNKIDRRSNLHKEFVAALKNSFSEKVFDQIIGTNVVFDKMPYSKTTILDYKTNNAYKELTNLLKELEESWQ